MSNDYRRMRNMALAGLTAAGTRDLYRTGKNFLSSRLRNKYSRNRSNKKARYTTGSRQYIGRPIGEGNSRRTLTCNVSNKSVDTRTLYSHDLTWISKNINNSIQDREREVINLTGFKIHMSLRGALDSVTQRPLVWNIAVICEKGKTESNDNQIDAVADNNFFRGNSGFRGINFGTYLSGQELNALSINNDIYTVLRHEKHQLTAWDTGTPQHESFKTLEWWIPIKRQIRYDAGEAGEYPMDGRCHLVYWAELAQGTAASATPIVSASALDILGITYWKQTCEC